MKWFLTLGVVISVIFGAAFGKMEQVSSAAIGGGIKAIELCLTLAGGICFWSGVMQVAQQSGITQALARLFSPLLKKLFRNPSDQAVGAISMNVSANLMGLGNAATPLGVEAMRQLQKQNPHPQTASHNMIVFAVLNTASLQIIPTTAATLRLAHGSSNPMGMLAPMLLTSFCSLIAALASTKIIARCCKDSL